MYKSARSKTIRTHARAQLAGTIGHDLEGTDFLVTHCTPCRKYEYGKHVNIVCDRTQLCVPMVWHFACFIPSVQHFSVLVFCTTLALWLLLFTSW